MIATFTRAGWRDFNQRYKSVFGFYQQQNGTDVLVLVSNVTEERVDFTDCNGITFMAYPDKGVNFKFIPITKRVFMLDDSPVVAQRVPARQYRRGICVDNTTFYSIRGYGNVGVDFNTVNAYLNASPVGDPRKDKVGVLSPMFSFNAGCIYLYTDIIGSISGNNIYLSEDMFVQEVRDCLQANNIDMVVS